MLKYDCNRAILLKEPLCAKNVIGKRVQVGRMLQGERALICWMYVLWNLLPPQGQRVCKRLGGIMIALAS